MRRRWPALVAAPAALAAGLALAQSPTGVEQLGPGAARERLEAAQVGRPARSEAQPQLSAPERVAPRPSQLNPGPPDADAPRQLTREPRAPPATSQLAKGARTAEPPAPLSTPAQGRTAATEVLKGDDRCDPRALAKLSPAERARCADVIERRSAEFQRPEPPEPSPEERLLVFQDEAAAGADARRAARSLAEGEVDDSLGAQAIAAGVGRRREEEEAPGAKAAAEELSPAARALLEAIVQGAAAPGVTVR